MSDHKKKNKRIYAGINMPELKNSIKTLLANIRFASIDNDLKSIAVVAAGVNEGKTTVSLNLAAAVGSTGKKALLIEGDMRKRSLAKSLNVHAIYGIYSVLSGKCLPKDAVIKSGLNNVDILDCEPNIPSPPDLLSTNRFAQLIKHLRNEYDSVIIDTPPLVSFVDGALIANRADATLVVIREGKAKRNDVTTILKQLETAKANILGTVLTFCTSTAENEYYYAYYNKVNKRVRRTNYFDKDNVPENVQKANLNTWLDPSVSGGFAAVHSGNPAHGVIEDAKKNKPNVPANEKNSQGAEDAITSVADSLPVEAVDGSVESNPFANK